MGREEEMAESSKWPSKPRVAKDPVDSILAPTPSSSATVPLGPSVEKDPASQLRTVETPEAKDPLEEFARKESPVAPSADLVGCQSRLSQLAEMLGVRGIGKEPAETSASSTRVPAVDSSPDDISRSTQTVRRELDLSRSAVDGFNMALSRSAAEICAAEDPWRSVAGLGPKVAELRALVSEAYPPRTLQRRSSMRSV